MYAPLRAEVGKELGMDPDVKRHTIVTTNKLDAAKIFKTKTERK